MSSEPFVFSCQAGWEKREGYGDENATFRESDNFCCGFATLNQKLLYVNNFQLITVRTI